MNPDSHGSDELKAILSNCDAKRDHNYRLGADSFTITTREYAVLRALVLLPSETRPTYEDGLEDAAQACERFSEERWALYKWGFGHERANNYTQGESDAGDKLAEVIRALKKADPQATEEKANPCGRSGPVGSAPCVASETAPMREALEHIARLPDSYPASAIIARAKDALKKDDPQDGRKEAGVNVRCVPDGSAPCVVVPPVLRVLADWEKENGSLAGVLPLEWEDLMSAVAQAAVTESPRESVARLMEAGNHERGEP